MSRGLVESPKVEAGSAQADLAGEWEQEFTIGLARQGDFGWGRSAGAHVKNKMAPSNRN